MNYNHNQPERKMNKMLRIFFFWKKRHDLPFCVKLTYEKKTRTTTVEVITISEFQTFSSDDSAIAVDMTNNS